MQTGRLGALTRLTFISTEHEAHNETSMIAVINFFTVMVLMLKNKARGWVKKPTLHGQLGSHL
jgi:hypothetical protein